MDNEVVQAIQKLLTDDFIKQRAQLRANVTYVDTTALDANIAWDCGDVVRATAVDVEKFRQMMNEAYKNSLNNNQ